jgi:Transcriptional regulators
MTSAATDSPSPPATSQVALVRAFNRFYTRRVGVLDEGHLNSTFSLTEVRVLYEIAHDPETTASALQSKLRLDAGYVSRLVTAFEARGLITRTPSPSDGRRNLLALSERGRTIFAELDARADADVATLLAPLTPEASAQLHEAMRTIRTVLGDEPRDTSYTLRPHRPGDMGFIVYRQAVVYAREYGWNAHFEALISRIVADFLDGFDPVRECCWIAERDGETVGSVFLVRHPERAGAAKLRLLYVEPSARGLGIGARLVHECTLFARAAGYHAITLWTNSVLTSARRVYEAEGYHLVHEAPHRSFGNDLVEQTWELTL